jgi:hypothetical protein
MPLIRYVNKAIGWLHVINDAVAQRAEQTVKYLLEPLVGGSTVYT